MAEKEVTAPSNKKQARQPPSVPFIWEVKPGLPKKDWKPDVSPIKPAFTPPVKLIASVPFNWEEKPGKPLPHFSQPSLEPLLPTPLAELASLTRALVPYSNKSNNNDDCKGGGCNNASDGDDAYDQGEWMYELDKEVFGFETDDSFCSAPSLLANCLVPSAAISTAVPVQRTSSTENVIGLPDLYSFSDSETESTTSSYATGFSSLVGASFLEYLFPLHPPASGFLDKAGHTDMSSRIPPEQTHKYYGYENDSNIMVRRPPTLGELIMMSRRRSCQRKAVQMREHKLSKEFNKRTLGCCFFGPSVKMVEGLQWKKYQPRLKLI
ncbi:uncharacterized protein LOC119985359 [Tripterygium wilfordii]|uniref:uncharacterized protein LOC119985359 n=1 Tax=Tripterygium wilfordii TaxID=458696 RepID=UPI0018F801F7|nr:uncharacterized protein LOC119985359 [Tripterygium wilfordii]